MTILSAWNFLTPAVALLVGCTGTTPQPRLVPAPEAPPTEAPTDDAPGSTVQIVRPDPPAPLPDVVYVTPPDTLFRCETSADCVIECDLPGNCCGAPCGCRTAVNRHVLADLKTHPWAECTPAAYADCPAMGCAYDPAYAASCDAGRCVASDGIATLPATTAPQACAATVRSTLPGVSIRVPATRCVISSAEASRGLSFPYEVIVADAAGTLTVDPVDAGRCKHPGPDGLLFGEAVRGVDDPSLEYAIRDTGLCAGGIGPSALVAGTHRHAFEWKGVQWFGPSDFGNPEGAPFPAGRYEVVVSATGTWNGAPYEVTARLPITLVP